MTFVDAEYLDLAIAQSEKAEPSMSAFSVGCVIVSADGKIIASGYSRELESSWHAEEVALFRARDFKLSEGATLYSSMEPCSVRRSMRESCCEKIIKAGILRVVFALREPPIFVEGRGAAMLLEAGITVVEISKGGGRVESINRHLFAKSDNES